MKFLFACDLDNTLIHSYKKKIDGDICIEIYNGREQSFISNSAAELLKKLAEKILFVPVTTRSLEQFKRINWLEGTEPKFSVVSNGANFLRGGKLDKIWRSDSYNFIQPYENELCTQQKIFSQDSNFTVCRIVDESFLFLKCADDVDAENISTEIQKQTNLTVQNSGRKIYLFPPKINKGEALIRLKKMFNPEKIFCAGDSVIDLPMLDISDVAFVPKNFSVPAKKNHFKKFFSIESALENILENLTQNF